MNFRNVIVIAAVSAIAAFSQAPAKRTKPRLPTTFRFLTPEQTDPGRLLPPPPKDGSPTQLREMADVKDMIHTRTRERHEQAIWDAQHENPMPWVAAIGPEFDLARLPATAKLLADVLNDQTVATSRAKDFFHRRFPVATANPEDYNDWTCDTGGRKPSAYPLRSYPSGHATMSYTFGIVLAHLIPEKSEAILARSADYAFSRRVCGDHYPSDVEAGHALGTALGIMLLNNPGLQPELQAAKAELRAAHITN